MRWGKVKLSDICEINPGRQSGVNDRCIVSFVAMADVTESGFISNHTPKTYGEVKKGFTPFKNTDILVAKITPCFENGKGALAEHLENGLGFGSTEFHILRPNSSVYPRYLFYATRTPQFRKEGERSMTGSAGQKRVPVSFLQSYTIPLPPLSVQKKVADILDKADSLRRKDKELLRKYDELAQSIFYDMFGDPFEGSNKFDVSTIGTEVMVKGGKRLPLGESLVKYNTGLPYIKAGNIKNGRVSVKNLEYLLPDTQKKIRNYTVKTGDVCVTIVGVNIGDVGIVPAELDGANLTENAAKLVILDHNRLDPIYLSNYWSMPFVQGLVKKRAMAVGVPKLALFRIEEIDLVVPPIELQKRFNKAVEVVNKQRELVHSQQTNSEYLFDSLLNSSFNTQKVR